MKCQIVSAEWATRLEKVSAQFEIYTIQEEHKSINVFPLFSPMEEFISFLIRNWGWENFI